MFARIFTLMAMIAAVLLVPFASPMAEAQAGGTRLGGVDVAAYCAALTYNAALVNNNQDFACVTWDTGEIGFVLKEENYIDACRLTHGDRTTIIARQDGNNPIPAYNWSCYSTVAPQINVPQTEYFVGNRRLGGLNISGYCSVRSLQAQVVNNNNDWACVNAFSGQIEFVLDQGDYQLICADQYHVKAFPVQQGGSDIPAYNWNCFENTVEDFGDDPINQFGNTQTNLGQTLAFVSAKFGYQVNVRANPNLEAAKLGLINANSSHRLLGYEGKWYRIDYYGSVGYVAAKWTRIRR